MSEFNWTDKRQQFCREYIVDFNGTQAAIRAGFAEKSAVKQASELLQKSEISQRIAELIEERSERTGIDADWVLTRLQDIADADIADVLEDDGSLKPISQWPKIWRRMVTGLDISELFEGRGEDREQIGVMKKVKTIRSERLYEMIGKHVNVNAFKERVELDATDNLASALAKARKRVAEA
ncbi:terminase small subunit [Marinobacterium jannaschii]|uniref:terminase small subunit n=1 Tax=Marinobacterium jannaschii TaxID=64970 RepID=UPI00047F54A3|nr:terminase small subunit [Marinobacterium jannaschii]